MFIKPESVFTYHSQEHSLSFSPKFCKCVSNITPGWLNNTVLDNRKFCYFQILLNIKQKDGEQDIVEVTMFFKFPQNTIFYLLSFLFFSSLPRKHRFIVSNSAQSASIPYFPDMKLTEHLWDLNEQEKS